MDGIINNIYKGNTKFFVSYEIGVMLAEIDNSMANTYLVESIKRICENVELNLGIVADGYIHYCKETLIEFSLDDMNRMFEDYIFSSDDE